MQNEILFIGILIPYFLTVVFLFWLFQEQGLYLWTVLATIAANIEVLIMVTAFGMEMTLGNILFASTFLVTDILSELFMGKSRPDCGLPWDCHFSHLHFLEPVLMLYVPNENDFASPPSAQSFPIPPLNGGRHYCIRHCPAFRRVGIP